MENVTISKNEYEELLKYKQIVTYVEEEIHNKEFNSEFIKQVEGIREEVKKGKKTSFKNKDEMNEYLDRL